MKRMLSIIAALPMAVVLGGAGNGFPKDVAAHIAEMDKQCRDSGGQPDRSRAFKSSFNVDPAGLVERAFAKGGTEVWVLDEGKYQCDGASSLFSGSGGAQVIVFARLNDGSV
jgi:hypothetical protein